MASDVFVLQALTNQLTGAQICELLQVAIPGRLATLFWGGGTMFARHFCYFAALVLGGSAPAAASAHSDGGSGLTVRERLLRAQTIMQRFDEAPVAATSASGPTSSRTRLAWGNWKNSGYIPPTMIPWRNTFANAAVPWGNGWANAPVHVNPWNNWTNWHNVAWNNGGAAAHPWLNATPTGRPGEVCSQGLGCSTPQAAPVPTYSEGQTYFIPPSGSTFSEGE